MNDIIVFGIFFGGVLAITAAAGQLAVENKDPRKYLLSSLMFCTGVWQIYLGALYHGFLVGPYTFFRMSHLPLALCVGPLLYLFLRDIADAKYEFGKISLLHFAPALLVAFVQIPLHFADPKIKVRLEIFSHNLLQSPDSYSFLVSGEWYTRLYFYAAAWLVPLPKASMIIYCVILLYYILKYWNRNDSIWMKMRLPILAALLSVTLASFTALIDHFVEGETYLRFGGFVGSLCVFFIYLLDRRFFEPLRIRNKTREYRQSRIKRLDKNSLRSAVLSLMDAEKLFLTEDLSLQMLSNELSDNGFEINPSQLSEFINSEFGKNYNQFLNEYRIREACEMLISEPERSVLSIALAAGFNSKSTFNRVFKTLLKITPLEYRESRSNQYI